MSQNQVNYPICDNFSSFELHLLESGGGGGGGRGGRAKVPKNTPKGNIRPYKHFGTVRILQYFILLFVPEYEKTNFLLIWVIDQLSFFGYFRS